jgi:MFS family permease
LLSKISAIYQEYPRTFWTLIGAAFIDRLGGALIYPFLALYVTQKFQVGMTQVGVILLIFSLASLVGSLFGGAMTDRFGRKKMLLFGLITSGLSSLTLGLISDFRLVYAGFVLVALPETMPELNSERSEQSLAGPTGGYGTALRDSVFIAFLAISTLMVLVYVQMNSTLSVYLRDVHGISPKGFGTILSLNAAMVVLFQFWITRRIARYQAMGLLAAGSLFYAVGFGMYGFVRNYPLFLVAMVIITIGEMLVTPTAQSLVARLAPEDMRGRYMALYGLSWIVPNALGPLAAGILMDNYNPDWVWYAGGLISIAVAIGYLALNAGAEERLIIGKTAMDKGNLADSEIPSADSIL